MKVEIIHNIENPPRKGVKYGEFYAALQQLTPGDGFNIIDSGVTMNEFAAARQSIMVFARKNNIPIQTFKDGWVIRKNT